MTRYLKSGDVSEEAIQKTVMAYVRMNIILRNVVIHIPNEGKRTKFFGKKLKDLGMVPGVSDLFIAMPRRGFGGAWIELKSKKGIISQAQEKFILNMTHQNYYATVCRSVDEAIKTINWYCFEQ